MTKENNKLTSTRPILLIPHPEGGWSIAQRRERDNTGTHKVHAAYSTLEEALAALAVAFPHKEGN